MDEQGDIKGEKEEGEGDPAEEERGERKKREIR